MMTHTRIVLVVLYFLLPLTVTNAQADTNATTTQDADESEIEQTATQSEPWYEIETIFGDIDVGDFVVGPGRTEIEVQPGETVTEYITVTNRISAERSFKLEVVDLAGSADGSAALQLVEDRPGPYSVRDFISFPEDVVTLNLGERARIPVTISFPANAEPGGYYGSILVSTVRLPTGNIEDGGPRNPIIARVGSHFFITVPGERQSEGALQGIDIVPSQLWYESGPLTFALPFENTGSVHLNPYGELTVTSFFGETVGYVEIEPWFVLPQSLRSREIEWDREFLFGRYTAKVEMNRGYDDIVDTEQMVFWVLPWRFLLGLFISVFVVFFLIRLFFRTFEFKRKT